MSALEDVLQLRAIRTFVDAGPDLWPRVPTCGRGSRLVAAGLRPARPGQRPGPTWVI